jgi:CDGSH-type Zn-finger protein
VSKPPKITVTANGPYLVEGGLPYEHQHVVVFEQGESLDWRTGESVGHPESYALCRCGHSQKKPFCDGSHQRVGFDGTETASHAPYEGQAKRFPGPTMTVEDAEPLCAFARFCDPHGQIWNLVGKSDSPRAAQLVEYEAGHCPSGRLVARRNGHAAALEPELPTSIGLIQDTAEHVSGGLWVRGGVPVISASGYAYEVRNRATLCRCGASKNKPFCDGSHASIRFSDRR